MRAGLWRRWLIQSGMPSADHANSLSRKCPRGLWTDPGKETHSVHKKRCLARSTLASSTERSFRAQLLKSDAMPGHSASTVNAATYRIGLRLDTNMCQ
jgi:hypothetical protein